MIFALIGLYDYCAFTNAGHEKLFELVRALSYNLKRYDTGFYSRYDLYKGGKLSSRTYHWLHSILLDALEKDCGFNEMDFSKTADKFRKYEQVPLYLTIRNIARAWQKYILGF
jgi:hypothetical protein